jgi:nickel-dependent lactate racemase
VTRIKLPYGMDSITFTLPQERLEGVLVSQAHDFKPGCSETDLVRRALKDPVESPRLKELARGKKKIVIISSDHTRPVPSRVTMPLLLKEIRAGNPDAEITILVATGMHRATTPEELRARYGDDIVSRERIVVHDSQDEAAMIRIGTLPSGGKLFLNRLAVEADLLAAEGFIEPHFFAGFSGGRKSVLPGIAGYRTVLANHCSEFIASPCARTGILENNPIHIDMLYAAREVGLAFILNVVIDADKKVIHAVAGHMDKAHLQGCRFASQLSEVAACPADIAVTTNGGYPLDQNIYQAVKGMTAAEATCRPGGVIIIAAECRDGHGGESFYNAFAGSSSIRDIMDGLLANGREETIPDSWEIQILARILLNYSVIMITRAPKEMIEKMHMRWAPGMEAALETAADILGKNDAKITVIPDGVSVIVKNQSI